VITREGNRLLFDGPVTIDTVSALLAQIRALHHQGRSFVANCRQSIQ
jgi:hypothetical protein